MEQAVFRHICTSATCSPLTIALAVKEAANHGRVSVAVAEKFLDELIGWRELAVLFVRHNPHYDSWECAEPGKERH